MRPSQDDYGMAMAYVVASMGTCRRRKVGCVLMDSKRRTLATGRNGSPSGAPHCVDVPCAGAEHEHGDLSRCEAIHAEQNALIQCTDPDKVHYCYTTTFPCLHCFKMLANTGVREIVFDEPYVAHTASVLELAESLSDRKIEFRQHRVQNAAELIHARGGLGAAASLLSAGLVNFPGDSGRHGG